MIDSSACQCCRTDLYTDAKGNIYVGYRGLRRGIAGNEIRDMMVATSADQGIAFGSPLIVSADNWNIDGCPHTGPSLCSNKGALYTFWYTEGNGRGIYFAHNTGARDQFLPRELISDSGHHPQMSANDDRLVMVWEETIGNDSGSATVINCRVTKNGADTGSKRLTSADTNAFVPVVTQTMDGFLLAFLMEADDHVGVYFTRL